MTQNRIKFRRHPALLLLSTALLTSPILDATAAPKDAAWYREKATLIFEDTFDREETGTGAKDIGNNWNSATANRVPHIKQADLDEGILKIASATKEAGHGAHIHHDAGFQDGAVTLRFKLPGLNPGERFQVGFVDRECKTVHAGHLGYAFIVGGKPGSITLKDSKSGAMNLELTKRKEEAVKATGKVPEEIQALLKSKETVLPWKADNEWHDLLLAVEGDVMQISVDGTPLGELKSEGFAHPVKRWLSFGALSTVWVDDVKVWKVQ